MKQALSSSFWLDTDQYFKYDQVTKLSIIQKTIQNFVNIITNKNIECVFLENTSNTKNSKKKNEKHGYSTAEKILISADTNDIDIVIGLALHEVTHIVKSDFDYKYKLPDDIVKYKANLTFEQNAIFDNLFGILVNFVEDLFCDDFQLHQSPGYIGYYKALYEDIFLSPEIDLQLKSNETKEENIHNYIFRIFNLFHKNSDESSLKGLKNIFLILDVKHISRLQTPSERVKIAWKIFNELINYCNIFDFNVNSNDDLQTILKKQTKSILHQFDKKKINSSTKQKVDNILDSKIKIVSCKTTIGYIKCILFEDLNFNKIKLYKNFQQKNIKAILDGEILSNKLKNKLQLRNEIKETILNRKSSGRLDKKLIYSAQFNDNIFYNKRIEKYPDAYIHFSIDTSGSMSSHWEKVIIILVSLIKSFKEIGNIDATISFRSTFFYDGKETPVVYIVYDNKKSNFELFKVFLKCYIPSGFTPDGICFNSILNRIELECKNKKSFFVNISDGIPYFIDRKANLIYNGEAAYEHTRLQINKIKATNTEILSFYVGEHSIKIEEIFRKIYGKNSMSIYNFENSNKIINLINSLFV